MWIRKRVSRHAANQRLLVTPHRLNGTGSKLRQHAATVPTVAADLTSSLTSHGLVAAARCDGSFAGSHHYHRGGFEPNPPQPPPPPATSRPAYAGDADHFFDYVPFDEEVAAAPPTGYFPTMQAYNFSDGGRAGGGGIVYADELSSAMKTASSAVLQPFDAEEPHGGAREVEGAWDEDLWSICPDGDGSEEVCSGLDGWYYVGE